MLGSQLLEYLDREILLGPPRGEDVARDVAHSDAVGDAGAVVYSQGNFVFDQAGYAGVPSDGATERGVVVQVRYHRALGVTVRTVPTRIRHRGIVEVENAAGDVKRVD